MATYQPKGGMCATCVHRDRRCDHLKFEAMPVMERHSDSRWIVRCTEYRRDFQRKGKTL